MDPAVDSDTDKLVYYPEPQDESQRQHPTFHTHILSAYVCFYTLLYCIAPPHVHLA